MIKNLYASGQTGHGKNGLISRNEDTIRCGGYLTSYTELVDRAAAVAAGLAELNVRPHDRVLIVLPDGPGLIQACAGVGRRGAVPLPVNPLLATTAITATAAETGARLVLAQAERIQGLTDLDADPPVLVDQHQGLWAAALR